MCSVVGSGKHVFMRALISFVTEVCAGAVSQPFGRTGQERWAAPGGKPPVLLYRVSVNPTEIYWGFPHGLGKEGCKQEVYLGQEENAPNLIVQGGEKMAAC